MGYPVILAVDDEHILLEGMRRLIERELPEATVGAFPTAEGALAFARENEVDIAFLDIRLRRSNGIELSKALKELHPEINIIFTTGYDEYACQAFELYASGYILKPVNAQKLRSALDNLRHPLARHIAPPCLRVQCFGNFEVYDMAGHPIHFSRSRAKEMLAYLVYRQGAQCAIRELAGVLFEDKSYDQNTQSYMQQIISSLMASLREAGAADAVVRRYGTLTVVRDRIECDFYDTLVGCGKTDAYFGEFMAQYSWAEDMNAILAERAR